jgi:hypothetical protein
VSFCSDIATFVDGPSRTGEGVFIVRGVISSGMVMVVNVRAGGTLALFCRLGVTAATGLMVVASFFFDKICFCDNGITAFVGVVELASTESDIGNDEQHPLVCWWLDTVAS